MTCVVRTALALLLALALPSVAGAAGPFFNSSESGCDGSDPNVLMCDDFESSDAAHLAPAGTGVGTWASENADVANSNGGTDVRTKGWAMRIRTPYPHSICGGAGAGGTNCAARSILKGGDGGDSALADHNLAPSTGPGRGSTYPEVTARFMMKVLPGYAWNNNQKFVTWNPCCANDGGIVFGGGPTRNGDLVASPQWDCADDNYRNPQNPDQRPCYLGQNVGTRLLLPDHVNNWLHIEIHIKLNTPGVKDGIYEMRADDCGPNGTQCSGTPTLRMRYTNVGFRPAGETRNIGVLFFDIWGNPGDTGTILLDQIKVVKGAGPVGFVGSTGQTADRTAPSAPMSPRLN